jgi:hypothetical protein
MKWSGLFSKIQRASALSVASGVVAATCSLGILVDSVGAAEPPEVKAGSAAQSSDETNSRKQLSDADKIALAKHNRLVSTAAAQTGKKPNFLIIWGDDVGWNNTSAYNRGMMGYSTPNIDRVAKEGALFTDWYGQQSCTAGRAAFITGQSPFRTGLLKVGLPGAKEGLSDKDPTIPELLKNYGYMTAQYGKNHLGDLDEHLPSNHGFDEFYGNLYHLNAEQEPEHPEWACRSSSG